MRGLSNLVDYLLQDSRNMFFGISDIAYANTGFSYTTMLCSLYCLKLAKSMVCLDESFYVYRILNNSMMHSYNVKKFEHFENTVKAYGINDESGYIWRHI